MRLLPKGDGSADFHAQSRQLGDNRALDHLPPFPYREGQTADDFAIACGSCNSSRRDKPLWVFIAKRGIADTIAPVIKAFLGRAKASEVLVQQEFVNLLISRPQVNG